MTQSLETDLLIIGGGATGGGLAWDAALRGLSVVLVEMGDLATGTSGRYHGLLHSGGRYAVRDLESAKECIDENLLLRRLVPQAIEDTGGYFVLCPEDDESYVDQWLASCKTAGIETREVSVAVARAKERALNPALKAVYEVPDGTCDSWDLLHSLQFAAEGLGAKFLTYHRVEAFRIEEGRVTGATVVNLRTGEALQISCRAAVNAAGPWAASVASLAGCSFKMRLSRGAMLAFNIRWVNKVINRLRKPGDGDIFVPVGTVSVTGTTSVKTEDPGDSRVESWEVQRILSETEPMTPGISRARILRAWGGVRPLYDGGSGEGRDVKRTFTLLDHADDGAAGLYSIVGGKLTTFRLMAEKTLDIVCARLEHHRPCLTASTVVPEPHSGAHVGNPHYHVLRGRLNTLEHGHNPGALICECEIVTDRQIRESIASGSVHNLHDLRRDLRLGMGPCQGGFCAYRAAAVRHSAVHDSAVNTRNMLAEYIERRFGGMKPLLWGHNLRQVLLNEHIYARILGLMPPQHEPAASIEPLKPVKSTSTKHARVVVIGAGLSGLMAARAAQAAGAVVEVISLGQGALTLHPGWLELGNIDALAQQADHPYRHAAAVLPEALGLLQEVVPLHPTGGWGMTGLGVRRPAAYGAGIVTAPVSQDSRVLIVGIQGWRDFFPDLIVDGLIASGMQARALSISLPHLGGNFDDWTIDVARYLDTPEGRQQLIQQVKPQLRDAQVVGFPAVLGFEPQTVQNIQRELGVPLFEIPTLTPSVPGLRLYHALRKALLNDGARFTIGPRVTRLTIENGRVTSATAETSALRPRIIRADSYVLATGGMYGGGLESDYQGHVTEVVAGLPVIGVPAMESWFDQPFTSGDAQLIQRVGIRTDASMRPLNAQGALAAANLFACGRLLAGASPVAEGCTEGVDLATGMLAGRSAVEQALSQAVSL